MELVGNWTGVCYYPGTRAFVPDNTLKLSIIASGEEGHLRGTVTETCERGGIKSYENEPPQVSEFRVAGVFDKTANTMRLRGECRQQERRMHSCVLTLKLIEEDEKLEGVFANPEREEDVQHVELHKGDVRRDLLELEELGRQFLERIRKAEGRS